MRHFPIRFEFHLHFSSSHLSCEQCFELFSLQGKIARTSHSKQFRPCNYCTIPIQCVQASCSGLAVCARSNGSFQILVCSTYVNQLFTDERERRALIIFGQIPTVSRANAHVPLCDDMGMIFCFSVPSPCAIRLYGIINLFANHSCSINNIGSRCRAHERGNDKPEERRKKKQQHIYMRNTYSKTDRWINKTRQETRNDKIKWEKKKKNGKLF